MFKAERLPRPRKLRMRRQEIPPVGPGNVLLRI